MVKKTIKIEGLQQKFTLKTGKSAVLQTVLTEKDFWQTKGRKQMTILTHDAVKKLADLAGVKKEYKNEILTQPDAYNNYQYTWEVKVCNHKGVIATGVGEANRSNLGSRGRKNPANMAEKRAYDRAVLRLLGITGLLSEEELQDEDQTTDDKMHNLSHEDRKKIAPLINKLMLATEKAHLIIFNRDMRSTLKEKTFSSESLDYLRKLYKKRLADLQKVSF